MADPANLGYPDTKIRVDTPDTQEIIHLTEALQELSSKLDRMGGMVVRHYHMTERINDLIQEFVHNHEARPEIGEEAVRWINRKVAKKRKKKEEKQSKKNKNR